MPDGVLAPVEPGQHFSFGHVRRTMSALAGSGSHEPSSSIVRMWRMPTPTARHRSGSADHSAAKRQRRPTRIGDCRRSRSARKPARICGASRIPIAASKKASTRPTRQVPKASSPMIARCATGTRARRTTIAHDGDRRQQQVQHDDACGQSKKRLPVRDVVTFGSDGLTEESPDADTVRDSAGSP